jgi:hypothetical protein
MRFWLLGKSVDHGREQALGVATTETSLTMLLPVPIASRT